MPVEITPTLLLSVLFSGKYVHRTCSIFVWVYKVVPHFSDNNLGNISYVSVNAEYIN